MNMHVFKILRGASAGALVTLATSSLVDAQEALPTIDIGAQRGAATRGVAAAERGGPKDPEAYRKITTSTATKTDTPIMQTPISIHVVPSQVLRDQQAVTIEDAAKNVSNVYSLPYGGMQGGWLIRGFHTYSFYQDGVRVNSFISLPPRDLVDVQQIEVLKGPASILYGRSQPAGLVEVTTKMPEAERRYSVEQIFGSYDTYITRLNATGPVTDDKSLLYRIDASYQDRGSFRDGLYDRHVYLAPKLLWQPTADTSFLFYFNYYGGRDPIDAGIPILGRTVAPVPRSANYASTDMALQSKSDVRFGYAFTHQLASDWKIVQRFDINVRELRMPWVDIYSPSAASCTLASCPVGRDVIDFQAKEQTYFANLELTGRFDTFGLGHRLLVGADGYVANDQYHYPANFGSTPSVELFSPGRPVALLPLTRAPDWIENDHYRESWYGVYVQDQITLPYDFHLLAGFRYDNARNTDVFTYYLPTALPDHSSVGVDAVKPRVGVVWQPLPQISLYGNYVENFGASNGATTNNQPLPPEEARQWEGGIKLSLLDDRLTATAAYFDILKTNVRSPATATRSDTTGAVRGTGAEFDIQGQITPEFKVIGGYAYTDSRIVSAVRGGGVGNHWYGVPRHAGSLWAVYEPQTELLKGFAFGAGFIARDQVAGNRANSFTLPGYTVVDLMSRYSFEYDQKKFTVQLNVNNLLDQTYYLTQSFQGVIPGTPRTFRGSLRMEF
ncbi:TonB-dependent siderophore receptor [Methylosinus sp. KRF6]|nr:TonB-dependent siderophore receptor [Methylosinus sp. KRF6]